MTPPGIKTRFAPSPTGFLHLGNVRTALFSALQARRHGGTFLLRIEDTDAERSRDEFEHALLEDLRWLGLDWQEGPGVGGPAAPYHQSRRSEVYQHYYTALEQQGIAYPCFCSEQQLSLARKAQRSAGLPPRYSGACTHLGPAEIAARLEQGLKPTLRFRVRKGQAIGFDDLVRGAQTFVSDDIGDFIIRRADGTPAFFFCNAIDDALMGVTHVLRGDDHLANTPRQQLILEALALPVPRYGHISMIVGDDGAPLSKRHGSASVRELRDEGYLPAAVTNHLARLGHYYDNPALMSLDELAAQFELSRLGKAPARHDVGQLHHWQREALARISLHDLRQWMGSAVAQVVPDALLDDFADAVRPNVLRPHDAVRWAHILFEEQEGLSEECLSVIAAAGSAFFDAALAGLDRCGDDFAAVANHVKAATGAKGKALFQPLRVALTGELHGPEMGRVLRLLTVDRAKKRIAACIG